MEDIDCPAVHLREEPAPIVHDRVSTYEIYQIPATEGSADYLYLPYEWAKEQLSAKDYVRVYTAPLEPGTTLDGIFDRHNRDDHPAAQTMRSLSVSDVVVVRGREGVQAFYDCPCGWHGNRSPHAVRRWQHNLRRAAYAYSHERQNHQGREGERHLADLV